MPHLPQHTSREGACGACGACGCESVAGELGPMEGAVSQGCVRRAAEAGLSGRVAGETFSCMGAQRCRRAEVWRCGGVVGSVI